MRLNKSHKQTLYNYAKKLIKAEPGEKERVALLARTEDELGNAAKRVVRAMFPEEDMQILKKYNLARTIQVRNGAIAHIRLNKANANQINYQHFYIVKWLETDGEIILPGIYGFGLRTTHPFWNDLEAFKKQQILHDKHIADRLQPYKDLLFSKSSTTLKKVLEHWPEAADCKELSIPKRSLPAVLSESQKNAIKKDMLKRSLRENEE